MKDESIECTGCGRRFLSPDTYGRHFNEIADRCCTDRELQARGMAVSGATGAWVRLKNKAPYRARA